MGLDIDEKTQATLSLENIQKPTLAEISGAVSARLTDRDSEDSETSVDITAKP